jgi:hypothetical protein
MGSHSKSLLFFIADASYICVMCSRFWILCYESCTRITKVLVDWPLNFKIVNSFEDVPYQMFCRDFKYMHSRISKTGNIIKLQNCCADFVFSCCTLGWNSAYSGKTEYWSSILLCSLFNLFESWMLRRVILAMYLLRYERWILEIPPPPLRNP